MDGATAGLPADAAAVASDSVGGAHAVAAAFLPARAARGGEAGGLVPEPAAA